MMKTSVNLTRNECKILAFALGWVVDGPYEQTPRPLLNNTDRQDALAVIDILLDAFNSKAESVVLTESRIEFGESRELPSNSLDLLFLGLASFLGELRSTPTEVEVVTGLPLLESEDLFVRLQSLS